MSEKPIKQILGDLLPYFESLETQSSAILHLLRDKNIANEEEISRYMQEAAEASSVKWRAARVRMEHLFSVSPDPTRESKTVEANEVKQANDQPGVKPGDARGDKPGDSSAPILAEQPGEERLTSEKTSDKGFKDAAPKTNTSVQTDSGVAARAEPGKKVEKAEKDAA